MEAHVPKFDQNRNQDPGLSLSLAVDVAEMAHYGQVDKGGREPYIRHPLRVMAALEPYGEDVQVAAVLHDVVEDSPDNPGLTITLDDLRKLGVAEHIVEAVDALTKRPGEKYEDAIERVNQNPIATLVKIADNRDNFIPERLKLLSEKDRQKALKKYPPALEELVGDDEWIAEQAALIEKRIREIYAAEQERSLYER